MKRLVYTNEAAIKKQEQTANELVNALNHVLTCYKSKHNHFSNPVDENFAYELVTNPLGTFDAILTANSPIKPIGGKQLDISKLAELTGIDREGFINDFTVILPGTTDEYARHGQKGLLVLTEQRKPFVRWSNDNFAINETYLQEYCERFRVYAETKEELDLLKHWENLAEMLNKHKEVVKLDTMDSNRIAHMLHLYYDKEFKIINKEIADQIKKMAVN